LSATASAFKLLHLHLAPPLRVTPNEFCRDFQQQKTRDHGISFGVVCVMLCLVVSVEHQLVTDGRRERQLLPALASVVRVKIMVMVVVLEVVAVEAAAILVATACTGEHRRPLKLHTPLLESSEVFIY